MNLTLVGPIAESVAQAYKQTQQTQALSVTLVDGEGGPQVAGEPNQIVYCCDASTITANDIASFSALLAAAKVSGTPLSIVMFAIDGTVRSPHAETISAVAQRLSITVHSGIDALLAGE